jgi:Protein of unknown function (DUF2842)
MSLFKPLPIRLRKLIGTFVLLVFLPVYALLAMAVTGGPVVINANKWLQMICYIVAGLVWIVPAGILIRWMSRDDGPA